MAQSQYTYQTTTTINVSQDHKTPAGSSPPPEQAPRAGIRREGTELVEDSWNVSAPAIANDAEVVEDSIENGAARPSPAQVNRPSEEADHEHDELYSLTPERPRVKAIQQSPEVTQQTEPRRKINALDALLARGARVHGEASKPTNTKPTAPILEGM